MDRATVLREGVSLLEGLTFDRNSSEDLISIFFPPTHTEDEHITPRAGTTPEGIRDAIAARLKHLFILCAKNEDVYSRCQGEEAFSYLILASWNLSNPAAPFSPYVNLGFGLAWKTKLAWSS